MSKCISLARKKDISDSNRELHKGGGRINIAIGVVLFVVGVPGCLLLFLVFKALLRVDFFESDLVNTLTLLRSS